MFSPRIRNPGPDDNGSMSCCMMHMVMSSFNNFDFPDFGRKFVGQRYDNPSQPNEQLPLKLLPVFPTGVKKQSL